MIRAHYSGPSKSTWHMMAVCRGWLDGSWVMRCQAEEGFQALVGVGNDVDTPYCGLPRDPTQKQGVVTCYGDTAESGWTSGACKIKAPLDVMQILSVVYDDTGNTFKGDLKNKMNKKPAPYVGQCQFCKTTGAKTVLDAFDDLSKCWLVDKKGKITLDGAEQGPYVPPVNPQYEGNPPDIV